MVDKIEFAEVYSSYSSVSRSLSYPRMFPTFGKTDMDASSFSKALTALKLEVHLLKPVLPTSSVIGVNIKYGQVYPYLRILRSFVFKCICSCSDGHVRKSHFKMNMARYQNGKIYKITHASCTKCYIGSTCATLSQRVPRHRIAEGARADTNSKYYEHSRQS